MPPLSRSPSPSSRFSTCRFTSDLGLTPGVRLRDPGGEIEPFHMFPFEKESSGQAREDWQFQWFDMARLNYLMTKFSVLMQVPMKGSPYNVALDIFPKAGQSQDCLQGFYGNYELFGAPPAPAPPLPPPLPCHSPISPAHFEPEESDSLSHPFRRSRLQVKY